MTNDIQMKKKRKKKEKIEIYQNIGSISKVIQKNKSLMIQSRKQRRYFIDNSALLSHVEPKNINNTLSDNFWIIAIEEELNQLERTTFGN